MIMMGFWGEEMSMKGYGDMFGGGGRRGVKYATIYIPGWL